MPDDARTGAHRDPPGGGHLIGGARPLAAAWRLPRLAAAALAGALLAHAQAGSLVVRDVDGAQWTVHDDPADGANDFLLAHQLAGGTPDARFGRNGQSAFTLGVDGDAPASIRVDGGHRIWMVGLDGVGNVPQTVVARFLADGSPDPRWGVQGKLRISPDGIAVRPNDLLPLSDGSVLVAGAVIAQGSARAALFHLQADGTLDRRFGTGGVWQRAGDAETSSATSLAAGADGSAALAVAVRGARPGAELWAIGESAPLLASRAALPDTSDGEDLRGTWVADHWTLVSGGGATGVVAPATLAAAASTRTSAAASAAASEPGQAGFSPFAADPGFPASQPEHEREDDSAPGSWLLAAALLALAAIAAGAGLAWRRRKARRRGAATTRR